MSHDDDCMIWEHQPPGADGWHDCTCNEIRLHHDSLCPLWHRSINLAWQKLHGPCQCDLIAQVRADERRQAVERVRVKKGKFPSTRLDWDTIVIAILDGTKLRLSKKELNERP